jgi:phosphatidylcholine synthase
VFIELHRKERDESLGAQRSRWIAWAVHLFTASGAAIALFALIAIATDRMPLAIYLMLTALVIDSVDGTLARAVRVTEHVPEIDGRRLDDIVDYLTYVIVPVFFLWAGGFWLHPGWLVAPVLASAIGFARVDAKTADDFFLGFPSYWNILAIYLFLFDAGPVLSTLWIAGLSIAVFVPLKYLYPSKLEPRCLRRALAAGGVLWCLALAACTGQHDWTRTVGLREISLAYPAWYVGLSLLRGGFKRS